MLEELARLDSPWTPALRTASWLNSNMILTGEILVGVHVIQELLAGRIPGR